MPNHDVSLEVVFRALADPARCSIVDRLATGPASVSELARPLAMSLPSVMQHLQVLEESGLMRSQKVGRVRICRIEHEALRMAENWLAERRMHWEQRQKRIGALLSRPKNERTDVWQLPPEDPD